MDEYDITRAVVPVGTNEGSVTKIGWDAVDAAAEATVVVGADVVVEENVGLTIGGLANMKYTPSAKIKRTIIAAA
jgi:hypothetical protein